MSIILDEESEVVQEHFAVVYTPRRQRTRFPENCVQTFSSQQEALDAANVQKKFFPARVMGPSRSSEGFKLYYLLHWLD